MKSKGVAYKASSYAEPISTSHSKPKGQNDSNKDPKFTAKIVEYLGRGRKEIAKGKFIPWNKVRQDKFKHISRTKDFEYVHWKGDSMLLGHLIDYPDYWTQGKNIVELERNLKGLHDDINSGILSDF
jgi:hypothetical protein